MDGIWPLCLFGAVNIAVGFAAGWFLKSARFISSEFRKDDIVEVSKLVEQIEKSTAEQADAWNDLRNTLEGEFVVADLRPHTRTNQCYGDLLQSYHDRLKKLDPNGTIVPQKFTDDLAKTRWAVGELADELKEAETRFESLDAKEVVKRVRKLEESNQCLCEELVAARKAIAEKDAQLEAARSVIFEDHLTKVHNRRAFDLFFPEFDNEFQHRNRPFCLLLIDIDHLSQINDEHGREAGDSALAVAAKVIRECCGQKDQIARFGDDEFAVLTPGIGLKSAKLLGEKIRSQIEGATVVFAETKIHMTCRVAVADAAPERTGTDLIQATDALLREAGESGRNSVRIVEADNVPKLAV